MLVLHRPLRCYRAVLTLTPRRVTAVFPKHPDVAAHQRHWTVQDFEAREQLLEERERKEREAEEKRRGEIRVTELWKPHGGTVPWVVAADRECVFLPLLLRWVRAVMKCVAERRSCARSQT